MNWKHREKAPKAVRKQTESRSGTKWWFISAAVVAA
jgi:hypothetical protein